MGMRVEKQGRVLVVGLKGDGQGIVMAVDNFVRAVNDGIDFDSPCHEEPVFAGCKLSGNGAFLYLARASENLFEYRHGLKELFEKRSIERALAWLNTEILQTSSALWRRNDMERQGRFCILTPIDGSGDSGKRLKVNCVGTVLID